MTMFAEFRFLPILVLFTLPGFVAAQCPTSLNNENGAGALSLYFASGEHPENLVTIDVDFPTIDGNYSVNNLGIAYQTSATVFSGETLTGSVTLNYSSGPSVDCAYVDGLYNDPLPVELSAFSGLLKQENILLYWTTQSEKDNAGFEIERSFDGEHFAIIGMVEGLGDSEMSQAYNFLDPGVRNRALSSTAYYRLVQIDYDGTKTYSEVLAIDLELDFEKFEITKITGWDSGERKIKVHFYNPSDVRKIKFLLTDIQGRIIEKRTVHPEHGLNTFEIDLSHEESPFYFLSLNNGKEVIGEKVALASDY